MWAKISKLLFLCVFAVLSNVTYADTKKTIGWVEPVSVDKGSLTLLAKVDTGADSSSLHAGDVTEFKKEGVNWVSFFIENRQGTSHKITVPVESYVYIKRRGIESQRRPVILLDICLDNHLKTMKVNLANRHNYKYQMLIGRTFLKGAFIVDSAVTRVTHPHCNYQATKDNE